LEESELAVSSAVSSGCALLAARWLGLESDAGRLFALDPATISTFSSERETPVIRLLNQPVSG
jgi:hypothetical protein